MHNGYPVMVIHTSVEMLQQWLATNGRIGSSDNGTESRLNWVENYTHVCSLAHHNSLGRTVNTAGRCMCSMVTTANHLSSLAPQAIKQSIINARLRVVHFQCGTPIK